MKIKKMNGFRNAMLTTAAFVLALSSVDGFSQTKFKKVIKDGKVTYLPVDNTGAKTKKKASTSANSKNQDTEKSTKKIKKKTPKNIVLFESNQCEDCRRIRRFFYKNKIEYTRKNIDLSKKFRHQLAVKTGAAVTPALFIDKKNLNDLSTKNIQKELGIQQKESKKPAPEFSSIDGKNYNKSFNPNVLIDGEKPKNIKPIDPAML